jgi:sigma-B regulation protein RsbU (phosphoserine phosphatase)
MIPATTMGGDFYDFIELPDGKIGLVMADVSGKGVPAAFFMAVARTNLRLVAGESSGPSECLRRTNDLLCTQNPMYLFVTIFYGIFDPISGLLTYANGGHNPPIIRRNDGSIEMLASLGDTALGIIEGIDFQEHVHQFSPGDSLVLYTDGVTEAFNSDWEEHGEERMLSQVRLQGSGSAKNLVTAIFDSVIDFAGTAPQSDDITITVLKWNPSL